MSRHSLLLIGTLDTKGTEILFVRDLIRARSLPVTVVDAGVQPHGFAADIQAEDVYRAAGTTLEAVRKAGDRGAAIAAAARGMARIAVERHAAGEVAGVIEPWRVGGHHHWHRGHARPAFRRAEADGQHPGQRPGEALRRRSRCHDAQLRRGHQRTESHQPDRLDNAAAAMIGMVETPDSDPATGTPTSRSSPRRCSASPLHAWRQPGSRLRQRALKSSSFTPPASAGRRWNRSSPTAWLRGVLDITTTELADELVGGVLTAGPDRLTAAGLRGVPQVISLGALDMVNFGPPETVPEKFRGRRFYQHNPTVTLMRTTPEENDQLGKEIAHKASAAKGPTAVVVPLRGVSALDREGGAVLVARSRQGAVRQPAAVDGAERAADRAGPAHQRSAVCADAGGDAGKDVGGGAKQ